MKKKTSPDNNLPPNERQVFGDWSAEIVWRHANLGKKDNFQQVGRCTSRLLYLGQVDDPGQALAICKNIVRDFAYAMEDRKNTERAGYKLINGKDILDEIVVECWDGRRANQ